MKIVYCFCAVCLAAVLVVCLITDYGLKVRRMELEKKCSCGMLVAK